MPGLDVAPTSELLTSRSSRPAARGGGPGASFGPSSSSVRSSSVLGSVASAPEVEDAATARMTRPERELHEKLVRAEADFLARKKAMTKQLRAAEASATVAQSDCQAAWEAQNAMDEENRTLRSRCKASEDREESIEAKEREVDKALLEHMGIATKLAELKLAWEDEKEKTSGLSALVLDHGRLQSELDDLNSKLAEQDELYTLRRGILQEQLDEASGRSSQLALSTADQLGLAKRCFAKRLFGVLLRPMATGFRHWKASASNVPGSTFEACFRLASLGRHASCGSSRAGLRAGLTAFSSFARLHTAQQRKGERLTFREETAALRDDTDAANSAAAEAAACESACRVEIARLKAYCKDLEGHNNSLLQKCASKDVQTVASTRAARAASGSQAGGGGGGGGAGAFCSSRGGGSTAASPSRSSHSGRGGSSSRGGGGSGVNGKEAPRAESDISLLASSSATGAGGTDSSNSTNSMNYSRAEREFLQRESIHKKELSKARGDAAASAAASTALAGQLAAVGAALDARDGELTRERERVKLSTVQAERALAGMRQLLDAQKNGAALAAAVDSASSRAIDAGSTSQAASVALDGLTRKQAAAAGRYGSDYRCLRVSRLCTPLGAGRPLDAARRGALSHWRAVTSEQAFREQAEGPSAGPTSAPGSFLQDQMHAVHVNNVAHRIYNAAAFSWGQALRGTLRQWSQHWTWACGGWSVMRYPPASSSSSSSSLSSSSSSSSSAAAAAGGDRGRGVGASACPSPLPRIKDMSGSGRGFAISVAGVHARCGAILRRCDTRAGATRFLARAALSGWRGAVLRRRLEGKLVELAASAADAERSGVDGDRKVGDAVSAANAAQRELASLRSEYRARLAQCKTMSVTIKEMRADSDPLQRAATGAAQLVAAADAKLESEKSSHRRTQSLLRDAAADRDGAQFELKELCLQIDPITEERDRLKKEKQEITGRCRSGKENLQVSRQQTEGNAVALKQQAEDGAIKYDGVAKARAAVILVHGAHHAAFVHMLLTMKALSGSRLGKREEGRRLARPPLPPLPAEGAAGAASGSAGSSSPPSPVGSAGSSSSPSAPSVASLHAERRRLEAEEDAADLAAVKAAQAEVQADVAARAGSENRDAEDWTAAYKSAEAVFESETKSLKNNMDSLRQQLVAVAAEADKTIKLKAAEVPEMRKVKNDTLVMVKSVDGLGGQLVVLGERRAALSMCARVNQIMSRRMVLLHTCGFQQLARFCVSAGVENNKAVLTEHMVALRLEDDASAAAIDKARGKVYTELTRAIEDKRQLLGDRSKAVRSLVQEASSIDSALENTHSKVKAHKDRLDRIVSEFDLSM